jgi:hypothetical protein
MRSDRARWLGVTLGLAVAIIVLSGWLRNLHMGPNQTSSQEFGVSLSAESAQNDSAEENRYKNSEAGSAFRQQDASDAPNKSSDANGLNE